MNAEDLARKFHDNYERLAPSHSYTTRKDSAKPWEEVPENNRKLMIATCGAVMRELAGEPIPKLELDIEKMGIGDLHAALEAHHIEETTKLHARLMEARKLKDGAYSERDRCIAMMAKMAQILGLRCGLGKHDPNDASWDQDWMNIVYIEFPAPDGRSVQTSWHVHDSEMHLFERLPSYDKPWDGHTTDEKYQRMADICMAPIGEP
jgi:hypothetical protein